MKKDLFRLVDPERHGMHKGNRKAFIGSKINYLDRPALIEFHKHNAKRLY